MADALWYYAQDDEQKGPISGAELRQLASSGKLATDDLVWKEGMAEWVPAQKVKGLFPDSKAAAKPAATVTAPPAAQPAAVTAPTATTTTIAAPPPERTVGPDFSEIESFTGPPDQVEDEVPPPPPEPVKPRRTPKQQDSTPVVTPRKSHSHHGHAHARSDGSSLLRGIQILLGVACGFVVLVGGVLLTWAMVKAKDATEQAAEGATYAAFFIGAYIVARAGEKLAELLRGK